MHLDRDTLELLALDAAFAPRELARIRKHLDSCRHCRERLAESRDFYKEADREFRQLQVNELPGPSVGLIRRERPSLKPVIFEPFVNVRERSRGMLARVAAFASAHRVVAGGGGAVVMGLLGLSLVLFLRGTQHENPAYVSVNPERMSMDVLSRNDQVIWHHPIVGGTAEFVQAMWDHRERYWDVVDIDADGTMEVVTTLKLARNGVTPLDSYVTVFNSDGSVRRQRRLGTMISFRGREFDTTFQSAGLATLPAKDASGVEFLVCIQNRRSPCAIVRLDADLNPLGLYWHYGHLHGPLILNREGDPTVVLLWGTNDVAAEKGEAPSTFVALDPAGIAGDCESSATPGFGFPAAASEIVYVRLPDPDVVAAASGSSSIWRIEAVTPSAIHLVQGFNVAGEIAYGVEYVLDLNWSVAGVRPISGFETHHKKLVLSGALSSVLGPEYFAALAREVRYWDGETWVMHSATVRQPAVRANQRPSPAGSVSNHGHGSDAEGPSRIPEMSEGRNRRR